METPDVLLSIRNHTKRFGALTANSDISFDIRYGETHCLLGENGAGKSTLAECLYGTYKPDGGEILYKGKRISFNSPRDAIKAGIGMVHQHFVLVPPMTVLENVIAGTDIPGITLKMKQGYEKLDLLCKKFDINLDLNAKVSQLSVGEQQWVEILKALYVGVELLILDEPTAVLTPKETEKLFSILSAMRNNGISIILITHKLREVMAISDNVTVLRKGKHIATVETSSMNMEELATLMVGREVIFRLEKSNVPNGEVVLEVDGLTAKNNGGHDSLHNISFKVHKHEILGIAGVAGNGQQELFDCIVGAGNQTSGKICLEGKDISHLHPKQIIDLGIASIPPDRIKEGLLMDFKIEENLILGRQTDKKFCHGSILDKKNINNFAIESIRNYDIAVLSPTQKTRLLSGGNLQKIILARELSQNPKFVIASSPTRGLDIGATEYIHKRLLELRDEGVGILLVSEDLDEIFNLSDKIAVIYRGNIIGTVPAERSYFSSIGLMMAGIPSEAV
jgi:simple sugar transport system ATP-binding protein